MTSNSYSQFPPGCVVMFLDSNRMVFTFHNWLDLRDVVLAFWLTILEKKKYHHFKTIDIAEQISQASNNIWKVLQIIIRAFVQMWWKSIEEVLEGISHPVFFKLSSLETKDGESRSQYFLIGLENSKTPSTSKVRARHHREDYRSCTWPFYNIVRYFL